jgi:pyruvate dehydrogenase E2 component (dihydrolipoamide acetyltransferase)
MSSREFNLPDLGEGLQEAEIVCWHVRRGDRVVENQPLVSVETDKAVVEIPSPRSGRIEQLLADPGDHVAVGAVLVIFDSGDAVDSGTVAGSLPVTEAPSSNGAGVDEREVAPVTARAIPAARQLANELGLDINKIAATGPGGTITREDVQRWADSSASGWQPFRGVRRRMAENMARAGREVVPASMTDWADTSAWFERHPPLLRLVLGVLHACATEPALNCHFDAGQMARRQGSQVHLGIATETDDGLLVPVLHDAPEQPAQTLASLLESLQKQAEQRTLSPDQLRGATITLSNFGAVGGEHAAMVVMPPQVAIVGAGRIVRRPWAVDDRVETRPVLPLSLSIDHRAVTGVEAARFMNALIEHLQLPEY